MRVKPILVVGIALFAAACATVTTKGTKPGTTATPPTVGEGSDQQGPSLNGDIPDSTDASRPDGRATGSKLDAVRVVGGQLFSSARAHD